MTLCQAIESFHRRITEGLYVQPAEYEQIRQQMSSAIPPLINSDLRAALKKKLEHGNEFSQRKRLKELVRTLPPSLRWRADFGPTFVDDIVDTRNYYTHCLTRAPVNLLRGERLWTETRRLELLARMLLWREMGLTKDEIMDGMSRMWKFIDLYVAQGHPPPD